MVSLLLLLHAWLGVSSMVDKSCTFDELAHLTAGHAYWASASYHLQPENGILPQRWVGLPAYLKGIPAPNPGNPAWARSDVWTLGYDYLYENTASAEAILSDARLMSMVWSVALGLLVFFWTRSLFGTASAFFSLSLFVFAPEFLANGPLATSDVCASFFLLASIGTYWRYLHKSSHGNLLLSSLCFGLACVAKFNAVLLLPIYGVLTCLFLLIKRPASHQDSPPPFSQHAVRNSAIAFIAHAFTAFVIIWVFYGFEATKPDGVFRFQFLWSLFHERLGGQADFLQRLSLSGILPEPYVYGFACVLSHATQRGAFLAGECNTTGWWYYFPFAFVVKSTLSLLVISTMTAIWKGPSLCLNMTRNGIKGLANSRIYHALPLLVLLAIYWLSALSLHLNIGHRHLLPIYAPLYIMAGALAAWAFESPLRFFRLLPLFLVGTQATESFQIRPHYLANFNLLAGGPANGYRLLVDSSLDWGQDLPGLASWLKSDPQAQKGAPVYIAYFGNGFVSHYLPQAQVLRSLPQVNAYTPQQQLHPGLFCISATMLQQPYMQPRDWSYALENIYQKLKPLDSTVQNLSDDFDRLRFMRLASWLRKREPDAIIGYSILVYRLDQASLDAALNGSLAEWASPHK